MQRIAWRSAALLSVILAAGGTPRAPSVASVTPTPNAVGAGALEPIEVALSTPLDPAARLDDALTVFGRWSGVAPGTVTLVDGGARLRFVPERPFQAGEEVTVTLRKGLATAGGRTALGFSWTFWVRAGPGSLELRALGDRTVLREGEDHVQPYGAYAGDFNGDGYPDLAIPNEVSADVRIMLNDGRGDYRGFTVLDIPSGDWPSPNEGADFNRDGIADVAVGNAGNDLVSVFIGLGDGRFRRAVGTRAGANVRGVCPADYDGNGWPDVATANMGDGDRRTRGTVSVLLNDGRGRLRLSRTLPSPGRGEKTCAVGDANEDGLPDLFVGAYRSDEVLVFLGDGRGGLTYHTRVRAGGDPWMIVAGDVNGDGHVDVVSANRTGNNVAVLAGDGRGGLRSAVTYPTGAQPMAVDVGDIDGDGDLDVVTSDLTGRGFTLYENAGDGTLVRPRKLAAAKAGSCAILHDRDLDGDIDVTGVDELADLILLFENPGR